MYGSCLAFLTLQATKALTSYSKERLHVQVYDAFETGMHQSVEAAKSSQTAVATALQESLAQAKALAGTMSHDLQEGQRHLMSLATEAASRMSFNSQQVFQPCAWYLLCFQIQMHLDFMFVAEDHCRGRTGNRHN